MDAPATGGVGTVGTSEIITAAGAFNGTADVVCQDGDVIVCELWGGGTQSMATAYTWTIGYDGTVDTGGSGGGGTGNAIASAASCMNSPPLILLGEGTPVSGTDANVGSANETAYVEVSDFPQNAVIDNFNRADGILTSPWVGMTIPTQTYLTPYVSSNQASTGPPGNGCGAYRSDQSFGDCEAYIDLPNPAETQYHDVWLRFTGGTDINAQNGYYLRHDSVGNKLMLQKVSGGGSSTVGQQANCTLSPGDSIGARVLGTTFSIYYKPLGAAKWRILGTGVDATYQNAGSTGFFSPGHPAVFDNFGGGSIKTTKSDVDATGINETETTAIRQWFSDVDATGINETETASYQITQQTIPVSDTNGATTEATSIGQVFITAADTNGATTESAGLLPQGGLVVRLDASALALADGATVSPWPNVATPGIPGTMTGSPGPTYRANAMNGQGVVRFSAGGGRMRMTGTGVTTPFTLLVVARDWSVNAGAQRVITTDIGTGNNFLLGWWNGYQDTVFDGGWASGEPSVRATPIWKLYSFDKTGANPVRMFSNGVAIRNGGSGSSNLGGSLNISGHQSDTAESCDCEVAELFLYNRVLSDAERQQVEAYLRNKWFSTPLTYSQKIQADAPHGYWRLNESAGTVGADSSGLNHPVTFTNGPVPGVPGPLAEGSLALSLDGVDDYAAIPAGVILPPNSSVTVEWWQYVATADVKTCFGFWMAGGVEATARISAHTPWSDKVLYWDCGNINTQRPTTDYTPYLDKWTLVQLTYDAASNKHAISFNGNEIVSNTTADVGTANFAGGFIGAGGASPPNSWIKARFAEFALYNYALSPAQRLAHYQAGMSKTASVSDSNGTTTESATLVIRDTDAGTGSDFAGTPTINVIVYEPDFVGTYDMLQTLYSPYSAIPASFGTYDSIGGAPLPLPVLNETATYQVNVPVSDSNGSTSESAAFLYAPASADAGTSSEAASPVVRATVTDSNASTTETGVLTSLPAVTDANGTTTESASITKVVLSDTDNAGFTAAQALTAQMPSSDAGSASDTASGALTYNPVSSSDSGTSSESAAFTYALSASDVNGSLTETASFQPSYVGIDSGTISESATVPKALITTTDNFSSIEAGTTGVPITNGDTGSASDSATVVTKITASDSGSAVETGIGSLTSSFVGTDQNTAVTESVAIAQTVTDSGVGTDTATPRFIVTSTDSGSLSSESQTLATLNQKTDADFGGSPIEAPYVTASLTPGGDQASATESASASIYLYSADVGAGIDASNAPVAKISVSDLGSGSDTVITGDRVTVTDSGTATELSGLAFGTGDTATGFDVESLRAAFIDADYGYGDEAYDRYPPLTLFPEIPAGVILSMAMGEIVNASSVGTYRNLKGGRGRLTTSARGRILK